VSFPSHPESDGELLIAADRCTGDTTRPPRVRAGCPASDRRRHAGNASRRAGTSRGRPLAAVWLNGRPLGGYVSAVVVVKIASLKSPPEGAVATAMNGLTAPFANELET